MITVKLCIDYQCAEGLSEQDSERIVEEIRGAARNSQWTSRSYFVHSVGCISEDVIRKYVRERIASVLKEGQSADPAVPALRVYSPDTL